jgi:hypothetical protein
VRYRLAAETDDEGSDDDNSSSGKVQRKRKAVRSAGKEPKSKRAKVDKDD